MYPILTAAAVEGNDQDQAFVRDGQLGCVYCAVHPVELHAVCQWPLVYRSSRTTRFLSIRINPPDWFVVCDCEEWIERLM